MEGNWDVTCRGKTIGKCHVTREGLYYRFRCRCGVRFDKVCNLHVRCGNSMYNLGVLVPMEGGFGLDTRIAVKRFSHGSPEFSATPRSDTSGGKFVAIKPEEPFAYLSRLQDAYLARRGDQIGVVLKQ